MPIGTVDEGDTAANRGVPDGPLAGRRLYSLQMAFSERGGGDH